MNIPFIGAKEVKQKALVFTEDAAILKTEIPIVRGYIVDDANKASSKNIFCGIGSAFVLDNEALIIEQSTQESYLPISILSAVPLKFNSNYDAKKRNTELANAKRQIAIEAFEEELDNVNKEEKKDKFAGTIRFIGILLAILFVICVIVGLFMAGKIHSPV